MSRNLLDEIGVFRRPVKLRALSQSAGIIVHSILFDTISRLIRGIPLAPLPGFELVGVEVTDIRAFAVQAVFDKVVDGRHEHQLATEIGL